MIKMMGMMSGIARAVGAVGDLLLFRAKRKPRQEAVEAVREARKAVAERDGKKVNEILERERTRSLGEAAWPVLGVLCLGMSVVWGCATRTMVIPADREVVPVEVDGRPFWLVPDATWADALEAIVKVSRWREMEEAAGL